jgi:hypothetical protein
LSPRDGERRSRLFPRRALLALLFAQPLLIAAASCVGAGSAPDRARSGTSAKALHAFTLEGSHATVQGRIGHSATLLPNGKVLLAGGRPDEPSKGRTAEIYDPSTGRSRATTQPMNAARSEHTATLLRSGQVLLAGGGSSVNLENTDATASAELYDPGADRFRTIAHPLRAARAGHTATLLPDGKVLLVGGTSGVAKTGDPGATFVDDAGPDEAPWAEIYDPETETFHATRGPMNELRSRHTATALPGGRVLIVGGEDTPDTPIGAGKSAEIYDVESGLFTKTAANPLRPFSHHTATLLPDGRVLLTGGLARPLPDGGREATAELRDAELYDPEKDSFEAGGSLARFRADHSATLLPSGRVLLVGGIEEGGDSLEIYDPPTGAFLPLEKLPATRSGGHSATLLPSGSVLIAGGSTLVSSAPAASSQTLLFDDTHGAFTPLADAAVSRVLHSATLLQSGEVLLAGGALDTENTFFPAAERYSPSDGSVRATQGSMHNLRAGHTATLLASGELLLAGGVDQSPSGAEFSLGVLPTAELYQPDTDSFLLLPPMSEPRANHSATLLEGGEVLITGGGSTASPELDSAELYDPLPGVFLRLSARMASPRTSHATARLTSGEVLIAGGYWGPDALRTAEIYDPRRNTFRPTGSMASPHASFVLGGFTATLLASGKVLIVGYDGAELYDPAADDGVGAFTPAAAGFDADAHRNSHSATLLPSGKVLIAGGADATGAPLSSSALYDPTTDRFIARTNLSRARGFHTATLLPSAAVLITGGFDNAGIVPTYERWTETLPAGLPRPSLGEVPRAPSGEGITLRGSRFIAPFETGSGATNSSATNLPLAIFLPLAGGLSTGVLRNIDPDAAEWAFPPDRLTGPGLLFLSAGTRRSEGVPLSLGRDRECRSTADCPSGLSCTSAGVCGDPVVSGPPAAGCSTPPLRAPASPTPLLLAAAALGLAARRRAISRR